MAVRDMIGMLGVALEALGSAICDATGYCSHERAERYRDRIADLESALSELRSERDSALIEAEQARSLTGAFAGLVAERAS